MRIVQAAAARLVILKEELCGRTIYRETLDLLHEAQILLFGDDWEKEHYDELLPPSELMEKAEELVKAEGFDPDSFELVDMVIAKKAGHDVH